MFFLYLLCYEVLNNSLEYNYIIFFRYLTNTGINNSCIVIPQTALIKTPTKNILRINGFYTNDNR